LPYWAALHFIEEISWMTYTMHQVTLEVRRQGIDNTPAQFKVFDVASDAFVCWAHEDWPPADLVPWEPPAETLYPPFWAEPRHGQPHTIALRLLPMVPTHAALRSQVRRKIEGWAPSTAGPMPEHTLNQVCLTIGMLGSEKSEQRLIELAVSAHQFTGQQALLNWCAEVFMEEIDLLSHARLQVEFEARQRGITDQETLQTLHTTALQEFMGTEAQWRQGYHKTELIG
jgi:hypothetical protein